MFTSITLLIFQLLALKMIGNIETLQRSGNSFLKDWTEWSEDNADLRYPDVGEIYE